MIFRSIRLGFCYLEATIIAVGWDYLLRYLMAPGWLVDAAFVVGVIVLATWLYRCERWADMTSDR